MNTMTEEEIRIRAYELWQSAGQPDGQSNMNVFWYEAEKQLLDENASENQTVMNGEPARLD
jgi:Protein of unknown function (DUF2934)